MASSINIGAMRDRVTLYFLTGSTADDIGSRTPTYTTVDVNADVKPLPFAVVQKMNLNFLDGNYSVTCRAQNYDRCVKVLYAGNEYTIISQEGDKYSQFLRLLIKRKV